MECQKPQHFIENKEALGYCVMNVLGIQYQCY